MEGIEANIGPVAYGSDDDCIGAAAHLNGVAVGDLLGARAIYAPERFQVCWAMFWTRRVLIRFWLLYLQRDSSDICPRFVPASSITNSSPKSFHNIR